MYVLSDMVRVVRVPLELGDMKLRAAVKQRLNEMLANKVVTNVGLCVALYDIIKIEESFLVPGDAASHTRVTFRFIVFRPAIGEILTGKIRRCTEEGIHVSMEFFSDTLIPPIKLQYPSIYNLAERTWIWKYRAFGGKIYYRYMNIADQIKFRVVAEYFHETPPEEMVDGQDITYQLMGSINEPGLGLVSWW